MPDCAQKSDANVKWHAQNPRSHFINLLRSSPQETAPSNRAIQKAVAPRGMCWRRCRSKPLLTHVPTTPLATRVALYPHACRVRGRNKWRSRRSARWLTPVSGAAPKANQQPHNARFPAQWGARHLNPNRQSTLPRLPPRLQPNPNAHVVVPLWHCAPPDKGPMPETHSGAAPPTPNAGEP